MANRLKDQLERLRAEHNRVCSDLNELRRHNERFLQHVGGLEEQLKTVRQQAERAESSRNVDRQSIATLKAELAEATISIAFLQGWIDYAVQQAHVDAGAHDTITEHGPIETKVPARIRAPSIGDVVLRQTGTDYNGFNRQSEPRKPWFNF